MTPPKRYQQVRFFLAKRQGKGWIRLLPQTLPGRPLVNADSYDSLEEARKTRERIQRELPSWELRIEAERQEISCWVVE